MKYPKLNFKIVKVFSSKTIGFALVEQLLGTFFSVVVLGGAGFGLVSMMKVDAQSGNKTLRRVELNRAIDYISEDIRVANNISSVDGSSSLPGSGTGVLFLTIPTDIDGDPSNDPDEIVYFARPSTSTWIGDNTINRAGGNYPNPVTLSSSDDNVLVDGLIAPAAADLPSCDTGLQGNNGFYACISDDNRTVELYLYGKLDDPNEPYFLVTSKVFARSN